MTFRPKVVAFCCNWCAYAGADTAGALRYQYSPDVRIIKVMCSGMVDPGMVLKCFRLGADGVMVLGCHPGDCHYVSGNREAEKRMRMVSMLMELLGINPGRLMLRWISASEGERFARTIDEFVKFLRSLGPLRGS